MNPFRLSSLENFIKIDMFIGISEPFLSPHHMSDFHLPVINNIGEMKSRPFIASDYDEIINGLKRNFTKDFIFKGFWPLNKIIFYSYGVRFFVVDTMFDLLEGKVSTFARVDKCA